ncbi:TOBE domain-containing protein, partial [Mycobacterium tuberculosis]|nr:TOBE domain-containing protein [Mycobacterium tuberculosis]
PRTAFVASFVGETNALPGVLRGPSDGLSAVDTVLGTLPGQNMRRLIDGSAATLFLRPEHLHLAADGIPATVVESAFEGTVTHLT